MNKLENTINNLIKNTSECDMIETNNISDGYHSFGELYEFRLLYNALLFNELANKQDEFNDIVIYKTKNHYDGKPCFDGNWFLVVCKFPNGDIIDNHYEMKYWDLFNITEQPKSLYKYDGHTPQDVKNIMLKHIKEDY